MKRREFISAASGLVAGFSYGVSVSMTEASNDKNGLRVDQPFPGAVLHRRSGDPVVGVVEGTNGKAVALKINVSGEAPTNAIVAVDGIESKRNGNAFVAEIELREKTNEIVVRSTHPSGKIQESRITVWWLRNSYPRYRFTVDDTIFCLREIHRNGYESLFDDYFLGGCRKLHKKYGTKFALNLFYETSAGERINDSREQFNLSQFSDKYKSEWKDNADWLRLLFHAKSEFPDKPYEKSSPETLAADFKQLRDEIIRFAGEETYLPSTVIHWGEIRPDAWKTLAGLGVSTLSGYFAKKPDGIYLVAYQMDTIRCDYLSKNDFLVDADSGIVFSKMDMVVNTVPLDDVVSTLENAVADPKTAEFVDLMTHEQYFWTFYKNYLPDHWDRLDRAFGFLTERGYKPVFLNDPLLGLENENT